MALSKRGRSWQIDYVWNGRRIRESVGPDKEEARILLAERLRDVRQRIGVVEADDGFPFASAVELALFGFGKGIGLDVGNWSGYVLHGRRTFRDSRCTRGSR